MGANGDLGHVVRDLLKAIQDTKGQFKKSCTIGIRR